jgi:hypothetical protein
LAAAVVPVVMDLIVVVRICQVAVVVEETYVI